MPNYLTQKYPGVENFKPKKPRHLKSGVATPLGNYLSNSWVTCGVVFHTGYPRTSKDQNTSSWATCKMDWLMLLLSPFVIVFIYPVIFLITMYGGAVFLHVYRHRRRQIYDAYADNFWDGGQQTIAAVFDAHGTLWHGK